MKVHKDGKEVQMKNKILVTGGAGFIGSTFVRLAQDHGASILVLDKLNYAGHTENLSELLESQSIELIQGDICDAQQLKELFNRHEFDQVINFAAESHVDNSISGPLPFLHTNVYGVFQLLEACRSYWSQLPQQKQASFRFLQVSTDEVYGELDHEGYFTETSRYQPNSPYSATKAAADHLVRAWHKTYGLPTIITNCSNNYGPRQFPEKLIPVIIQKALEESALPVYGKGENIRDWIHVEDHCRGLWLALTKGIIGETYCFGGNSERTNIMVVEEICNVLDQIQPRITGDSYKELISFVKDRPGHDFRYAIDDTKACSQLGFQRKYENFEQGLQHTINWYLNNGEWMEAVMENKNERDRFSRRQRNSSLPINKVS